MEKRAAQTKLYFIGIIPTGKSYSEASQLKQYFKEHYNSKASLNSPPHITLHTPFQWQEENEAVLIEKLDQFSTTARAFQLQLLNFDSFPPRVIFIHVELNDALTALHNATHHFAQHELNLDVSDGKELPFRPHITLAFRDLKKPMFAEAWSEFQTKTFADEFLVDKIALLKHNGKVWEVFREFTLQSI